tara:strand:+ start:304 stop:561 length:258 start_codon:yes stop_codon:yes gene_type:complete
MIGKEKILDDVARLAGGTVGALTNIKAQIREEIRLRVDEMALKMDLVPRAEFERTEALLKETRIEQEKILKKLEELENQFSKKGK